MKRSKNNGFGKLGLIISLMIIGVLAFLSIPIYNSWVAEDSEASPPPKPEPFDPVPAEPSAEPDSNESEPPTKVLPKK